MASPITFGGLASGLDTKSIIAALVSVEGRKVTLLQDQRAGFQGKITAYDTLLGKLTKLQTASEALSDPDTFVAHDVSLSDGGSTFLKATPGSGATTGTYQIEVDALAQSTFVRSSGQVDANASLGLSGTLSLQVGTTVTNITVDSSNDSLNGIRDAIKNSGAAISATVVFDGTNYELELRGKDTGVANAVTVLSEPPGSGGPVLNLTQVRAASDAQFKIDGQPFTSASNTVTTAIQGVTLQLLDDQAVGAAPIQLTLNEDFSAIQTKIQSFLDAYNDVTAYLADQNAPRASSDDPVKPLSGESALNSIRSSFAGIVSASANVASAYTSLASLGIRTGSDGKLTIDAKKLNDALGKDVDGVVRLFTDPTNGIGARMVAAVDARTDSIDGTVGLRKTAFQTQMKELDKRIARAQDALDAYEQSLVQRFSQYEQLIGTLQAQGSSLSAIQTPTTGG